MYANGLIDPRDIRDSDIDHKYLVTKFIPNVIELFEKGGFSKSRDGEKSGGFFLFAFKDKLFEIASDYQVGEAVDGYLACGSGEYFALGSLHSTENYLSDNPILRIYLALQAASRHAVGVEGPFHILNTKNKEIVVFDY